MIVECLYYLLEAIVDKVAINQITLRKEVIKMELLRINSTDFALHGVNAVSQNGEILNAKIEAKTVDIQKAAEDIKSVAIVSDKGVVLEELDKFNILYQISDETDGFVTVSLSSDHNTYNTYYTQDEDGFITGTVTTVDTIEGLILYTSGEGAAFARIDAPEIKNEDGAYLHKNVNGVLKDTTATEKKKMIAAINAEAVAEAIKTKLAEISSACNVAIETGVDYNEEHFSYTLDDQNNLNALVTLAQQTQMDQPYHADGKTCRMYTIAEIIGIYVAEQTNLVHNQTYHNQLKLYVQSLTSVEDINAVQYGNELTGEYLATYQMIMTNAQAIIKKFLGIED